MKELVLDSYLGKEVVVFIDGQDIAGEFVGYDDRSYIIQLYGEYVAINRRVVEMVMPVPIWDKIKEAHND